METVSNGKIILNDQDITEIHPSSYFVARALGAFGFEKSIR